MRSGAAGPRSRGQGWGKAHNATGYFWVLSSACFLTKLLWHHTCFCSSLEASAAWQMVECLHNECSLGSVCGGGSGTVTGGTGGQQDPSPKEAVSPSIPDFAGETSHPVEAAGVCPQLCSSFWQSHPGHRDSAAANRKLQRKSCGGLKK